MMIFQVKTFEHQDLDGLEDSMSAWLLDVYMEDVVNIEIKAKDTGYFGFITYVDQMPEQFKK